MGDSDYAKQFKFSFRHLLSVILIITSVIVLGSSVSFASSENHHEVKGWVATDSYRVLNFAVLAVGIFFAVRKPVANALGGRVQEIKNKLEDLEAKKIAAETQLAEYDKKLADLDKETENILSEYVKQSEEAKSKIIAEAEIAAIKLKEQAKKSIEHEFMQAKIQLQREVVDKALIKASEIIKEKIDLNDQEKLVDEYLEKVVA